MASLFDTIFQPKKDPAPTPAVANANANPTVPNANNTVTVTDPNAVIDPNALPPSPMDKFKDLWKTDPNAKPEEPFKFNSDPAALMDTTKTVDFTKVVSPELQKRIAAGGEDALRAMMEATNGMTQMAFAQSAHASSKIVESALQAQETRFKEMLPSLIKQFTVNDSLRQNNPLMNDPAMAPMIEALQVQFTRQYPQATADQIKSHVNDYLNGAADRITGLRPQAVDKTKRPDTDWSKLFGV